MGAETAEKERQFYAYEVLKAYHATEEPYTSKEKTAAFELARNSFQRVAGNEHALRLLRAQAKVAQSSIAQHQEMLPGG